MKPDPTKKANNNPEHAWFTGHFSVETNSDDKPTYRLYVYPGKNSVYPADIRTTSDDGLSDDVFEGRVSISGDRLSFLERANINKPDQPEWICTLSAVRAGEDLYLGGPETSTGLFTPELALRIAQMTPKTNDSPESRALIAQIQTLRKRAVSISLHVVQADGAHATEH